MANIAKIELGDTTYDIKDAVVRPKIDAITAEDTDGNTYVQTSKLTVNGDSNFNGTIALSGSNEFTIKSENINRDTTETIAETQWGSKFRFIDNDNETIGYIEPFQRPSGSTGLRILGWNEKSNGEAVWNGLGVEVAKDGTLSYIVSNPASFRTAISAAEDKDYAYSNASQHPWFWNPGGSNQIWAVGATCQRSTNTFYYGKQISLVVENTNLYCYNNTDDSVIWRAYTTAYKPTPADIGAAAVSHTHNYLPLSGGTLTGNLINKANYYQNGTKFAAGAANSTGGTLWNGGIYLRDTNSFTIHEIDTYQDTNGVVWGRRVVQNLPTATSAESERKAGQISIGVARDGTISYSVSSPDNFRTAISAAAASHNHSAANITSGTLETARGGLGSTTYSKSTLANIGTLERYGHLRILRVMTTNTVNLSDSWTELQVGSVLAASDRPTVNIYSTGIADDTGGVGVGLLVQTDGKFIVRGRGGTPVGNHKVSGELCWIII